MTTNEVFTKDYTIISYKNQTGRLRKAACIAANMVSLWQCRTCRGAFPHWPMSGERANYAGDGWCKYCLDHKRAKNQFEFQMQCIKAAKATLTPTP